MIDVNYKTEGEKLTLFIEGRIDSANAPEIEGENARDSGRTSVGAYHYRL